MKPHLSLYHYPSCPYCQRVRRAADELGIALELRDIHAQPGRLGELLAATGRRTVPVLRIEHEDGKVEWLPESRDIIEYLRDMV
jgi:glutathione S-transferase